MFQSQLMQGQRILVTGGGTGLGQAMAEQYLRLGADIAICGRRKSVCEETAARWREAFPERNIDTFGVDIRDAQAVEDMVEALRQSGESRGWSTTLQATSSRPPKAFRHGPSMPLQTSSFTEASTSRRPSANAGCVRAFGSLDRRRLASRS